MPGRYGRREADPASGTCLGGAALAVGCAQRRYGECGGEVRLRALVGRTGEATQLAPSAEKSSLDSGTPLLMPTAREGGSPSDAPPMGGGVGRRVPAYGLVREEVDVPCGNFRAVTTLTRFAPMSRGRPILGPLRRRLGGVQANDLPVLQRWVLALPIPLPRFHVRSDSNSTCHLAHPLTGCEPLALQARLGWA